jgi:hypothetical protein
VRALREAVMIDPASGQFSFPLSAMAEVDAREVVGRVLTDEIAPLRDRVTKLLSGLLESGDTRQIISGDDIISVKVITGPRSVRVEITDSGSGVVLGGLRRQRGPASQGWSPHLLSRTADRWGLVSDTDGAWVWFELDLPYGAGD